MQGSPIPSRFSPALSVSYLAAIKLNDYRLKPVGFVVNRERRTEVLRSRFSNLKIIATIIGLGPVLQANVLHNHFIRHIAARRHKIAPRPKVTTPKLLLNMLELIHQLSRGLALDKLHDLARRYIRWAGQQHMHMIARNRSLQNLDIVCTAYFTHQVANPSTNRSGQDLLAILCNPHKMVFYIVTAM